MRFIFKVIKFILPQAAQNKIRPVWHGFLALLGNLYYGRPSEKIRVIGVTGTAGKSTTVQMLARILNHGGFKTGYITTVEFFDGDRVEKNQHGLSMPGGMLLQKSLGRILDNGCVCAIVEATSEGLAQNRHLAIQFDGALLTNLSEAHLQAHGGFENYRAAKAKLFQAVERSKQKKLDFKFPKFLGINLDDLKSSFFASYRAEYKFGITFLNSASERALAAQHQFAKVYLGEKLDLSGSFSAGSSFEVDRTQFQIPLPGRFNAVNAFLSAAAANACGISLEQSARALAGFNEIAGRMQEIPNSRGFKVFLDYAPEPLGMENALAAVSAMPHKRLIHVFGSTGGRRDSKKRFKFGAISARYADEIIITNDDVYDSDPEKIADDVTQGIREASEHTPNLQVARILDRRAAIKKALVLAAPGDVVIITGKGSEQFLILPGDKRILWDEQSEIENALASLQV